MSKKILDNFDLRSKKPIDKRYVVNNLNEIDTPYEGLKTFCNGIYYNYINGTWEKDRNKSKDFYNLRDFNCLADNTTDETVLLQNTIDFVNSDGGHNLYIPRNVKYVLNNLIIPNGFKFIDESHNTNYDTRFFDFNATNDQNTLGVHRQVNTSGGSGNGYVDSAFRIQHTVNCDNANYQWGLTCVLANKSNTGENVSVYAQAMKYVDGGKTWAMCVEAKDMTGLNHGILVGMELDVAADGADTNNNRVGIDLYAKKAGVSANPMSAICGIRITADSSEQTHFNSGVLVVGSVDCAFDSTSVNGNFGMNLRGSYNVGIDFSQGTITAGAIRMASGQHIAFEASDAKTIKYNTPTSSLDVNSSIRITGDQGIGIDFSSATLSTTALKLSSSQSISMGNASMGYLSGSGLGLSSGLFITGTPTIGLDTTNATPTGAAIRIKAGQEIALDVSSTIKMKYNATTDYIEFYKGTVRVGYISMSGTDHAL